MKTPQNPIKSGGRIRRALLKAEQLTSIRIEVLLTPGGSPQLLKKRIQGLWDMKLIQQDQAILAVDPIHRNVAIGFGSSIQGCLDSHQVRLWLEALVEDLHMTHFENAVAMGVVSLALALAKDFPQTASQVN